MLLDLKFSIGTLGIGSGALIAGLYGMNLKNFLEESDIGFIGVTGSCFIFAAIVYTVGLHKLRRVQRVSMWGERRRTPGGRGSWNQVEPGLVGPGVRGRASWATGRDLRAGNQRLRVNGGGEITPTKLSIPVGAASPVLNPQTPPNVQEKKLKKRSLWTGKEDSV